MVGISQGISKVLVVGFAIASLQAEAAPMCSAAGFNALKQTLGTQNSVSGVATKPAIAYNGLNAVQIATNRRSGVAESLYTRQVFNRLASAAKKFIETDGDATQTAVKVFGDGSRRQVIQIYKRAEGDANAAALPSTRCGASSCADMSLEVIAMHSIPNKTARQAIDLISLSKLSTIGSATSLYCQTGAGCTRKDQITSSNSSVQSSASPSPMTVNQPYTVREIMSASFLGKIDNTSVYKVTPLSICGHLAFILSGVATRDQNSFSDSSSDVLVVEAGGRVLTLAVAQGIAPKGSQVPGIFLSGIFGGKVIKTLAGGYNDQAEQLGADERVTTSGMLSN